MELVRKSLCIERIVGHGAFGRVYAASPNQQVQLNQSNQVQQQTKFALKCVYPILKPQKLANELRLLRDLGGQCNVVKLHRALHQRGSLFIVMEMIEHDRFSDIVYDLDCSEIVMYMEQLLIALQHVHKHGVMHRDIKPGNFLFNRKAKKFLLVDFGLAQTLLKPPSMPPVTSMPIPKTPTTPKFNKSNVSMSFMQSPVPIKRFINMDETQGSASKPTKRHLSEVDNTNQMLKKLRVTNDDREPVRLTGGAYESPITHNDGFPAPSTPRRATIQRPGTRRDNYVPKSGTPGFKAPEILLRYKHQTTAVDLWSAGVIFIQLLSGHTPFFRDSDDARSLLEVIKVLGSQKVVHASRAMGLRFDYPRREPIDLKLLCQAIRRSNSRKRQMDIPDSAFDLLSKMLDPNPMTRITAEAALQHAFITTKIY